MWSHVAVVAVLVACAAGAPGPAVDDAYPEEQALYPGDVTLISSPENLVVREGDDISLPCQWEGGPGSDVVVMWKKLPNTILFTNQIKMSTDERVGRGPQNELVLRGVTAEDAGRYLCSVLLYPDPLELEHTVTVQTPAKLHPLDSDTFTVKEGESFELVCRAEGVPMPTVTWSKAHAEDAEGPYSDNGDFLDTTSLPEPEGDDLAFLLENTSASVAFTLDPVEPRHSGTYTCTAQNSIGEPAFLTAKLEVIHAPQIELETDVVRTSLGLDTEIVCKVFANPRAEVSWQRNGMDLPISPRYERTVSRRFFSLKIQKVIDDDLGNYTCRAKNSLGHSEHHISLTGLPGDLELQLSQPEKAEEGGELSSTVSWELISYSALEETIVTLSLLDPPGHAPKTSRLPDKATRSVSKTGQLALGPLRNNATYRVRVEARNRYGWTRPKDVFFHVTGGKLTVTEEPPQLAESRTSSSDRIKLTPILLIVILSVFC